MHTSCMGAGKISKSFFPSMEVQVPEVIYVGIKWINNHRNG